MSAAIASAPGADPMMLDTPATKGTAVTAALSTGGSDGNTTVSGGRPSTDAAATNSNSDGKSGAGQAPTQIKLSISQADAARMLDASRSFNEALRTIQEERSAAAANNNNKASGTSTSTADGSTGAAAAADTVMAEAKKKQPAKGASSEAGGAPADGVKSEEQQQPQEPQARSPSPMEVESNDEGVRTKPSFSPGRANNNNSSGTTSGAASTKTAPPLHSLLVPAAERCTDSFIQSYLKQMRADGVSRAEMEARLLLFLDMDKSGKLLSAFVILGGAADATDASSRQENDKDDAMDCSDGAGDGNGDDEIVVPGPLSYGTVSALLRSFLTSISICIHRKEGAEAGASAPASFTSAPAPKSDAVSSTPPSKAAKSTDSASPHSAVTSANSGADYPWQMDDAKDEIAEIAKFATDRLADHIRSTSPSQAKDADDGVSFEAFGDWYNSGGFKLVPWIELLDLAKWDYAGRAAVAAAAAAAKSSRYAQRREALAAANASDPLMGVIAEEAAAGVGGEDMLGLGPMTPNLFLEGAAVPRQPAQPSPRSARTVVSFDFTGAMPSTQPFQIRITEGNLRVLKDLVTRTGLSGMSPDDVSAILLRHAEPNQNGAGVLLRQETFGRCLADIAPPSLDPAEMGTYTNLFMNFFSCFDNSCSALGKGLVDAKELAVGFSFLCAGNKSTKLATAFELMDDAKTGHLCSNGLSRYLRSYLTMLVGISLLSESAEQTAATSHMLREQMRSDMFVAVENGSQWTKDQFIVALEQRRSGGPARSNKATRDDKMMATFEDFAQWYTEGGYTIAPWLELLDLTKFLSLINTNRAPSKRPYPSPGAHQPHADILFTFPLANHQSLVVLREDASYVKSVVTELCLSVMTPEQLWNSLYGHVKKKPLPALPESLSRKHKSGVGKALDVDQATFVASMDKIMKATRRKNKIKKGPKTADSIPAKDTLKNFFLSFDMHQVDRVAVNELMGGLILLCGGKKSMKLAFAFGLFDGRPDTTAGGKSKKKGKGKGKKNETPMPPKSLDGKELFLFLRSFLIVMFSCCKQSLDLSAEEVSRYIYDTAHVIAQDVMKFQWDRKKQDRVNFDEFGEWYNEGGFETAPWLELLDLKKWVYAEEKSLPPRSSPPQQRHVGLLHKKAGGGGVDDILAAGGADDFLDDIFDMNMDDDFDLFGESTAPVPGVATANNMGDSGSAGGLSAAREKENVGASKPPSPKNLPAPRISGSAKSRDGASAATERRTAPPPATSTGTAAPAPPVPSGGAPARVPVQQQHHSAPHQQRQLKRPAPVAGSAHQRQNQHPHPMSFPPGSMPPSNQQMMMMRPPPPHSHHVHSQQSLKYNLNTGDPYGGYIVSISQPRVRHLRELVIDSGLCRIDGGAASSRVMEHASKPRSGPPTLNRQQFNAAMEGVLALSKTPTKPETKRQVMELLSTVFATFDSKKRNKVSALEVAAGITVLCNGRKSDKLELAFDLVDVDNDGKLSRADMTLYLKSFLTVLVRVTTSPTLEDDHREASIVQMRGGASHSDDTVSIQNIIEAGSQFAVKVATDKIKGGPIDFDKFAQYYTAGGFQSMPWLELLDLNKWLLRV